MQLDRAKDFKKLHEAIQELMDGGAVFISVTSAKRGTDMSNLLLRLRPLIDWDTSECGVANTASGPGYFCTDTSISFWSEKALYFTVHKRVVSEGGVPAHGLFFESNIGQLVIYAASWPSLPSTTKRRMVDALVEATGDDVPAMIVSGSLSDEPLGAENMMARMTKPMRLYVSGSLSLYMSLSEPGSLDVQDVHTDGPHAALGEFIGSAEQLAAQPVPRPSSWIDVEEPAPQPFVLQEPTPLWNAFIDTVTTREEQDALMDYITQKCFFGETLSRGEKGEKLENPMSFSVKMEMLLRECQRQRETYIAFLRHEKDLRCSAVQPDEDELIIFNEEDLKIVMNSWRGDIQSYMSEEQLQRHSTLPNQEAHQLERSTFAVYQFHLAGCKWLLRQFLRLPLISAALRETTVGTAQLPWKELLFAFEEHKFSQAYLHTVEASKKKKRDHVRLPSRLWEARRNHNQGKDISFKVCNRTVEFASLSPEQNQFVEDYETGRPAKVLDVLFC